jgi:hypothetical protein
MQNYNEYKQECLVFNSQNISKLNLFSPVPTMNAESPNIKIKSSKILVEDMALINQ